MRTTRITRSLAAAAVFLALGLLASTTSAASTKGNPSVDQHSRKYVRDGFYCQVGVALVRLDISQGKSDIKLADDATNARDTCESARDTLSADNTDHFADQAMNFWYGIDRYKSGLNALLNYIDTGAATKAIEVKDKFQQGDAYVELGLRGINARRKIYGLKVIKATGGS